jgi:opacity protein-like surface antigen
MMKRNWLNRVRVSSLGFVAGVTLLVGGLASPASAQVFQVTRADARHSVGFNLGYFMLRSEGARRDADNDDVLIADLRDLAFEVKDFNSWTFGGEWLYGVSNHLETGVSVGYYQRGVPSLYRDVVHDDGREIEQEFKLRVVPITATIRFLPAGRGAAVEPYIGGGIGIFNWRYTEEGEFVDFSDDSIFERVGPDKYKADGTAVGPVFVAGLRFPLGDALSAGFEYKWQKALGDTNSATTELLGDKIDLGGNTFGFTFHFRF